MLAAFNIIASDFPLQQSTQRFQWDVCSTEFGVNWDESLEDPGMLFDKMPPQTFVEMYENRFCARIDKLRPTTVEATTSGIGKSGRNQSWSLTRMQSRMRPRKTEVGNLPDILA